MYDTRNFFAPYIQGPGLSITVEQGYIQVGGISLFLPRTVVSLAANATTYVYLNSAGAIATSNVGFPSGSDYPIAVVITGPNSVLTLTDSRPDIAAGGGGGTGGIAVAPGGNTAGITGTVSTGTLILAGGNNITLNQDGQSISIIGAAAGSGQFSAGISGGNTSGNTGTVSNQLVFAGGNNITLSGSTDVNGMTATISAFNQSVQTQGSVLINGSSGSIVLTAGPNISLQQNASTITISGSNQSVQTQNCVDLSISGNTSGALALISSGTAILAGGPNITLSQNGQSISISAPNPGAATNVVDVTLSGNTSGALALISSGTMTLAGGNNITLSQNGNAVTISAFNQSEQTQNCVDLSLSGNTAGALALISSGTAILAGGNNVTLSQNGNSVTISAFNQSLQTQNCVDVLIGGNTTGTTTLVSSGTLTIAGGNNITISQAGGNAITISGPSSVTNSLAWLGPFVNTSNALIQLGSTNMMIWPLQTNGYLSATQVNVFITFSMTSSATNNSTGAGTIGQTLGIYTRNVSTLSLASSASASFTWSFTSNGNSLVSGPRMMTMTGNFNVTPGDYWIGYGSSTSSSGQLGYTASNFANTALSSIAGILGAAATATVQIMPGFGVATMATAGGPLNSSIAFSQITGTNPTQHAYPLINVVNFTA